MQGSYRRPGRTITSSTLRSFRYPVLRSRLECHARCGFDSPHKRVHGDEAWRAFSSTLARRAVAAKRRLRTCSLTRGFASRLRNQAGCRGAPASEATITKRPPSSRYRTGTVRSRRDLRPVVVSRRIGAAPIFPIIRPPLTRYSHTFNAMKALVGSFVMNSLSGASTPPPPLPGPLHHRPHRANAAMGAVSS